MPGGSVTQQTTAYTKITFKIPFTKKRKKSIINIIIIIIINIIITIFFRSRCSFQKGREGAAGSFSFSSANPIKPHVFSQFIKHKIKTTLKYLPEAKTKGQQNNLQIQEKEKKKKTSWRGGIIIIIIMHRLSYIFC